MYTNIFLIRHAHSDYTPDELTRPLSEAGSRDSEMIPEIIKYHNITHVISSPYKRAIQTVEGIAKSINQEIEIIDGFKERILSEVPVDDFQSAIKKVWEDPYFAWDGGESNVDAQERGIQAMNEVLERYVGENIVIGTHGNILTLILNYYDNQFDFDFWKELDMPDIYKLSFNEHKLEKVQKLWMREGR